jgi:hypothetical protein
MGPPCRQLPFITQLPHLEVVHVRFGDTPCVLDAQGKLLHLGTFNDRVRAARHYDKEAIKHNGAEAILNFPPDDNPSGPFTCTSGHVTGVPGHEGHREEPSASKGLLPAGIPEGIPGTVLGSLQVDEGGPGMSLTYLLV